MITGGRKWTQISTTWSSVPTISVPANDKTDFSRSPFFSVCQKRGLYDRAYTFPRGGLRINRGDLPTEPYLTPSAKVAFERRQRWCKPLQNFRLSAGKWRMRNAGDALWFCTKWVPMLLSDEGRGTIIGNLRTFPPAFLFSLVFLVRLTFSKTIGAYKRTENSTASPRGKQYLKSNFTAYV